MKLNLFSESNLYKDSYEAIRLSKGIIYIFAISILLIVVSVFDVTSDLFKVRAKILVPGIILFQISLVITTVTYYKYGFNSKLFRVSDLVSKVIICIVMTIVIYYSRDPRNGWWLSHLILLILISQVGRFSWFFVLLFILLPWSISILYHINPELRFSFFHKSFGFFIGIVFGILYYYQCKLREKELMIKENNLKLVKELGELDIMKDRERISRELHDTLGSYLTGAILYVEVARDLLYKDINKTDETLEMLEDLSRDALIKMRESIYSIMDDNSLIGNFSQYLLKRCQELLDMKGITIQYFCPDSIVNSLPLKYKFNLYKVVIEWLTNIIRHSNATKVIINFTVAGNDIHIAIVDDGIGFDKSKASNGRGLNNINYRIKEINSIVNIHSVVKEGSTLEVIIKP